MIVKFSFSPPEPVIHNGGNVENEKRIVNEKGSGY